MAPAAAWLRGQIRIPILTSPASAVAALRNRLLQRKKPPVD
jgi:hypothetical protein